MRALLPEPADDVDLHDWYARDWLEPGGLRVDFVSSVDGAATSGGASEGLQTPGDNRVFVAMRDLADVVLAGAGTVRTEGYGQIRLSPQRLAIRRHYGLADTLPTAVVSRALNLDPTAALFTASDTRTIVLTCAAGDPAARTALERVADVVICGDHEVDLPAARAALEQRGLRRILCEGGPTLFADLARAGVADELCLSMTPILTGPGERRIVGGSAWPGDPRPLTLASLLEEDGALFARYRFRPGTMSPSS